MNNKNSVGVIIPVYKPGNELTELMEKLKKQTVCPSRITVMYTLCEGESLPSFEDTVSVFPVNEAGFDHGKTRNEGAANTDSEYLLFMTQDCIPESEFMIESLLKAFDRNDTAVAYARQLPREDAGVIEKYTRKFNYPEVSTVKTKADIKTLGIKTFFCSDVCAMYKKEIFTLLGGFETPAVFNEDMVFAYKAISSWYSVVYAADARVIHSHNYSCRQLFKRNFDMGISQAGHPEIFKKIPSEKEGLKLVKDTSSYLFKIGKGHLIFKLFCQSFVKYLGYFLGKHYRALPEKFVRKYSMNKNYRKENR